MIEQKIIVHLTDVNSNDFGVLSVSSIDYHSDIESDINISDSIALTNIPLVDEPDNLTPIQYWQNPDSNFANLMLLEETEYQILFESDDVNATYDVLYSLTKMNDNHFRQFRFDLGDNKRYKIAGTLNFRSYVGKSFLDIRKNGLESVRITIEVRYKTIDYFNKYLSMIHYL